MSFSVPEVESASISIACKLFAAAAIVGPQGEEGVIAEAPEPDTLALLASPGLGAGFAGMHRRG